MPLIGSTLRSREARAMRRGMPAHGTSSDQDWFPVRTRPPRSRHAPTGDARDQGERYENFMHISILHTDHSRVGPKPPSSPRSSRIREGCLHLGLFCSICCRTRSTSREGGATARLPPPWISSPLGANGAVRPATPRCPKPCSRRCLPRPVQEGIA